MKTGHEMASLALDIAGQGCGYIWGASGQVWKKSNQDALVKTFEERYGSDWQNDAQAKKANKYMSARYGSKWIGKTVYDCSGLTMHVADECGVKISHSSNSQYKGSYLSEKGMIAGDLPEGALVFKARGTDYYHVGIYVGGGKVVEAKGTKCGVVITNLSEWGYYGLLKGIDYKKHAENEVIPMDMVGKTAIVDVPNDGSLNVREKPSLNGNKLDAIREGAKCTLVEVVGDWARITYTKEGYVMRKYLKVEEMGV